MIKRFLVIVLFCGILGASSVSAQVADTIRIDALEFIRIGMENSARIQLESNAIELGEAREALFKANKVLPEFSVTTNHGILPSPSNEVVDPASDFDIDWSNLDVFTRFEFRLLQPITTWGALNSSISAAKSLTKAEIAKLEIKKRTEEQRLFDLYQGRVLSLHLKALLVDAEEKINEAKKRLSKMEEEGDEVSYRDIYQLKLFEQEFLIQKTDLLEQLSLVEDLWTLVLSSDYQDKVVLPVTSQLSAMDSPSDALVDLLSHAKAYSPETMAAKELLRAAKHGYEARKSSFIPMMYLGFGGEYVNTPIPVAQQPLIGNRYSYANLVYSFGFRFNLNWQKMSADLKKSRIELNQAKDAQNAASQLKFYEVREAFKSYQVAKERMQRLEKSLDLANEWLRQEQVDYDLEIGELDHLIDAVKASMQYKVDLARSIHAYNSALITLYSKTGYSLTNFDFSGL